MRSLGLTIGIALIASGAIVPAAGATVITVNTGTDEFNGGGSCSLREAVQAANTNAVGTGCSAGQPGVFDPDFIDVPANTYTLTQPGTDDTNAGGDLDIADTNVTIRNTGGGQTTIVAPAGNRGIDIVGSAFGVAITGIRITGGAPSGNGGAIQNNLNGSSLTLTNVTLNGNNAGGGGGGGGIFSGGGTTLALNNVTISGNASQGAGGAVLYNSASNSFFENSTIVDNVSDTDESGGESGGGIKNNDGASVVNVSNTILAGNSVVGEEFNDCAGRVVSGNNNLISTDVGCSFLTPQGSDLVGADHAEIAANLSALADNGGTVQTRLPLRTSPAINRGYVFGPGTTCEPTDARGIARPQEGRCDIGAVEPVGTAQTWAVTTTGDEFDGSFASACSLRESITASNNNQATGGCPAGDGSTFTDTIQLPAGTYALTRSGVDDTNVLGDLDLLSNGLVIAPTGPVGQTTIDGAGAGDRVLQGHPGTIANVITSVNIRNGTAVNERGGGIMNAGDLYLRNVTVTGNTAEHDGGGIAYANTGTGDVTNSTVSGNEAGEDGGGIAGNGGDPDLHNVTVTQNTADTDLSGDGAGGIAGFLGMDNTIVAGNTDASGGDRPDCFDPIPTDGYNLIGNADGCDYAPVTGDLVGSTASPISAGLGPLADNGGRTLTRAPVFGSAALNAGNPAAVGSSPACLSTDQRGVSRPLGGRCDIGSVEIDPAAPVTPLPTVAPTTTGQRAAALKKCKKKKTARAKKKCKKKAKKLPF